MALRIKDRSRSVQSGGFRANLWGMLAAAVALLFSPAVLAESLEYRVKAAFLYNFTKFVNWPPETYVSDSAPLDICILGSDPFGSILDETVRGKSANSHPLNIRRISQSTEMRGCEILFFGSSEFSRVRDHVAALNGKAVLTISDAPEFLNVGGMIRFLLVDGKVRFEVNRKATDQANLTVSSKLLSVAHAVRSGPDDQGG